MHLGNAFAALGAWLAARAEGKRTGAGSRMLLRIEDIDTPRAVAGADRWIMEDLSWLGLDWEGEPVYQSQHTDIYEAILRELSAQRLGAAEGTSAAPEPLVYPCYCTRAQLRAASAPQESDGFVLYPGTCRHGGVRASADRALAMRLAMPENPHDPRADVRFMDRIFGQQSWNLATQVGDIVLQRSDGLFAYQFAVVVDDYLQGVNQIVRGRDLLRSTAAQIWVRTWVTKVIHVSQVLPFAQVEQVAQAAHAPHVSQAAQALDLEYAHLPLLLSERQRRLAKRDHSLEVATLREQGVAPQKIVGYLAYLLGIIARPEPCTPADLVPEFSWEKIRAAGLADRQTDTSILAR
jgi:glutamyl-tRNA synthetase